MPADSTVTRLITDKPFWDEVLKPRNGHTLRSPLSVLLPILEGYGGGAAEGTTSTAVKGASASEPISSSEQQTTTKNDIKANEPFETSAGGDQQAKSASAAGLSSDPFAITASKDANSNNNQTSTSPPTTTTTSGADHQPNDEGSDATAAGPSNPPPPAAVSMPFTDTLQSPMSLSLLEHVLMYMVPMDQMRYVVPAMSASWNSTAVVERVSNRVVTHGSMAPPAVSARTRYKSVICGDTFIALLTSNNEVQVAGQLETPPSQISSGADPQLLRTMTSNKVKMLSGHGSKLLALTTAHTIRPLSVVPANTKTLIPYRLCKHLETGLGDDCYMVGFDNVLYKTTASQRALGTPRRVMTMSKVGVSRTAAGAGFLIVIDLAGRVYTLGKNKKGQLGNNKKQDSMRKPYLHAHLQNHFFVNAAAGDYHSLVLASDGTVYGAGSNEHGQLGLGAEVKEALTMTPIPLPARCTSIVAGPSASLFACADDKVYVCGFNDLGMLGVDSAHRAEKIISSPLPLSGVQHGVVEMILDNLSLSAEAKGIERPWDESDGPERGNSKQSKTSTKCCCATQ